MTSQYELAAMGAEMDADMMPGATVEQDVEHSRVLVMPSGVIVGAYSYRD